MGRIGWGVVSGPITVVTVRGTIGLIDRGRLEEAVTAGVGGPVVIDLSSVSLIDAAIARALRNAGDRFTRDGWQFIVAGAAGQPLEVLEIIGIAKQLRADLTLAEALLECRGPVVPAGRASLGAQVHELVRRAREAGISEKSRARLFQQAVERALPLARTLAHRYRGTAETPDDLMQVAALGLVNAVRGYDPGRGSGFLAYAVPTIRGELRRHLRDHTWMLRPARRVQETRSAVSAAWPELAQTLGRTPSTRDLALRVGSDVAGIDEAAAAAGGRHGVSLDGDLGEEPGRTWHDVVGQHDIAFERTELRMVLGPEIAALDPADREILALRMGTDLTQAEIGRRVGTSQMSVSRSLGRTLDRLRAALDTPR
jgi:RNA polymerase sigma-B factor